MVSVIIGIDPGVHGGICALKGSEILLIDRCPRIMTGPKNQYDHYEMARLIKNVYNKDAKVYIEKVHAMPKQGVTSMFNFGKGYGIWIGICSALRIPIEFVRPQQWKKVMLENTDKSKGAAVLKAKQLFPDVNLKPGRSLKDHDGMAEAILIAIYGGLKEWK